MATPLRHVRQVLPDEHSPKPVEPDWAAQTADSIERVVVGLRSKTTEPLERVVRVVVYGIVAAVLVGAVVVLLSIALVRAVDIAVPGDAWSAHLAVGGTSTALGLLLWVLRRPRRR